MRTKTIRILLAPAVLMLAGCAGDVTESDEYQDLEDELAAVEVQLADMAAERDALTAEATLAASRHEKTQATQEAALAIMADPRAFGTEDEVLALLDELAAPGTVYGDAAFGSTVWRTGWKNTLFGQVDATIRTWTSWLSHDGSVGGSLWTWSGTAQNGEPFDLQGIEVSTFDENGRYTSVMVHYPFEDAEVMRMFSEGS
ncbi:MAG: hypothetical protein MUQ27_15170 [Acidimicrobiia bacterium]|nr:hypothetical protein [Acidimicrobiia bacterium]